MNSGGQNARDNENEASESEASESEASESEANESEASESEANESNPREIEASESEQVVTMSDSQVHAELQATIDTTANISTILSCYNCSKKIATSEPKSSRGWNSCEKCPNWCCAKCSRIFFDANQYFCTPCANKLDTTIPRTLIRTRQKVYVEKMKYQYNVKHKAKIVDFVVGDKISVKVDRLDCYGTETSRLPGEILSISRKKVAFYEIGTAFGILDTKLRAGDLMLYYGIVTVDKSKNVGIREAHRLFSERAKNKIDVSRISCKCSGKCKNDNRCKCFSNKVSCTSHCSNHSSKSCCNNSI